MFQSRFQNLIQYSRRYISLQSRPDICFTAGQPTHETRPHYIPSPGNISPGISALEYYERRLHLVNQLPEKSLAILIGNQVKYSSGSVFYPFQQNTDLFYLTGWLEPNSIALIEKHPSLANEGGMALHMLVPPANIKSNLWEGAKLGLEGAQNLFNADYVESISLARRYINTLISRNEHVYWDNIQTTGTHTSVTKSFQDFFGGSNSSILFVDLVAKSNTQMRSLSPLISAMRLIKSPAEIKVMHAASQISSRAINQAIARVGTSDPFSTEKTLAKFLEYAFVKGGCDSQAYIPVVASGRNALTIHYTRNDDLLYRDEAVFIDAGGKLGGYCSDISRSWPNSALGFLDPHRDIYQAVLNTNKLCIDLCNQEKQVSLHDIHIHSVNFLCRELRNLPGFTGLTTAEVSAHIYPHYVGHYLGLDLHDVPSELTHVPLTTGMVVTIEPGAYVPYDDRWPRAFHGVGVRVEDDIVIGQLALQTLNLSSDCVKEVPDIELLISGGKTTISLINNELVILDI